MMDGRRYRTSTAPVSQKTDDTSEPSMSPRPSMSPMSPGQSSNQSDPDPLPDLPPSPPSPQRPPRQDASPRQVVILETPTSESGSEDEQDYVPELIRGRTSTLNSQNYVPELIRGRTSTLNSQEPGRHLTPAELDFLSTGSRTSAHGQMSQGVSVGEYGRSLRTSIMSNTIMSQTATAVSTVAGQTQTAIESGIDVMYNVEDRVARVCSQVWSGEIPGLAAGKNPSEARATVRRSQTLGNLLAFDDPHLLRATFVGTVMGACGSIFQNTAGSAETYELSKPVERIHAFISHNWAVARVYKFLILCLHFNLHLGAMAALIVIATSSSLTLTLGTPAFSCYCGVPAFLGAMLFGRSILCGFGLQGPSVFLDKCCIHQTDKALQRRGIEKLGAYMANSNKVLICFTDMYLKRLWTVYEVATFLAVNSANNMAVIPLCMPVLLVSCCLWSWPASLIWWQVLVANGGVELELTEIDVHYSFYIYIVLGVATACGSIGLTAALRYWARQISRIEELVQNFDVRTAECFDEGDRIVVMKSIAKLMRHIDNRQRERLDKGSLLDEFNVFVRTVVPQALRISVGRVGVPYKFAVAATAGVLTLQVDVISTYHVNPFDAVLRLFVHIPLCIAFVIWSVRQCLRLRGVLEVLYLFTVAMVAMGLFMGLQARYELRLIEAFIGRTGLPWYVLCVRTCLLVAFTAVVYWPVHVADKGRFDLSDSSAVVSEQSVHSPPEMSSRSRSSRSRRPSVS